jgi:hypothetical protein
MSRFSSLSNSSFRMEGAMRTRIAITVLIAFFLLQCFVIPTAHATVTFGDPHNCDALAQHATYTNNNFTPSPFHASQIPNSPTYNWGSDYLVACQQANPTNPGSGFNNANWDGYGNPFQCVELIDRYEYLRYHDLYSWGDPTYDWKNNAFPNHYVKRVNGDIYPIVAGDILIWNNDAAGHIAVVIAANARTHKVTVLEQNNTYSGPYFSAERVFYYAYNSVEQYASISGSNYTAYRQDLSTYTASGADPVGWLHSTS